LYFTEIHSKQDNAVTANIVLCRIAALWCTLRTVFCRDLRAGFTPSGAPVQKKTWGPLLYEYPTPTAFTWHAQ